MSQSNPKIKKINKYMTTDGKEHNTEVEATIHQECYDFAKELEDAADRMDICNIPTATEWFELAGWLRAHYKIEKKI
jgi:hypothetical protein